MGPACRREDEVLTVHHISFEVFQGSHVSWLCRRRALDFGVLVALLTPCDGVHSSCSHSSLCCLNKHGLSGRIILNCSQLWLKLVVFDVT